jgi:hypothetical protein
MVAAVAAVAVDELEESGVAAFWAALPRAAVLAPQNRRQAMDQLTRWNYRSIRGVNASLRDIYMAPALFGNTAQVVSRLMADRDVRVPGLTRPTPRGQQFWLLPQVGQRRNKLWHFPGDCPVNAQPWWG